MAKGHILVDLDGTLAEYDGWHGETYIGKPIEPMVKRVRDWLAADIEVRIFTARVSGDLDEAAAVRKAVNKWTVEHIGALLPVTCIKDYNAIEIWDDRAVQVIRNTGLPVHEWIAQHVP